MIEEINNTSMFYQFLPIRDQHDYAAVAGTKIGEENGIFQSFQVSFFKNSTAVPFVLPNCGLYQFGLKGYLYISIPVSSDLLFSLCKIKEKIESKGMIMRGSFENEEIIRQLNLQALKQQIVMNNGGRIICVEREELERLRQQKSIIDKPNI